MVGVAAVIAGKSVDDVLAMDGKELEKYFMDYAGYMPMNPVQSRYVIRVGVKFFYKSDTHELRNALEKYVSNLKHKRMREMENKLR